MRSGWAWQFRGHCWLVGLCLVLGSGCATTQTRLERALRADGNPAAHAHDLDAHYRVHCPDVLEVHVEGDPARSGKRPVAVDGRIHLDSATEVRAAGHTAPDLVHIIASRLGLPDGTVAVRVAEYNSESVYLFGEANTVQRVVPYRGPETILDLVQRVGLASPGASLGDIRVVRSHIADGKPPEVFHIDLSAVLLARDLQTNIIVEPFDRLYIGESCRSRLACCVPPVLQPLYRCLCGINAQE